MTDQSHCNTNAVRVKGCSRENASCRHRAAGAVADTDEGAVTVSLSSSVAPLAESVIMALVFKGQPDCISVSGVYFSWGKQGGTTADSERNGYCVHMGLVLHYPLFSPSVVMFARSVKWPPVPARIDCTIRLHYTANNAGRIQANREA